MKSIFYLTNDTLYNHASHTYNSATLQYNHASPAYNCALPAKSCVPPPYYCISSVYNGAPLEYNQTSPDFLCGNLFRPIRSKLEWEQIHFPSKLKRKWVKAMSYAHAEKIAFCPTQDSFYWKIEERPRWPFMLHIFVWKILEYKEQSCIQYYVSSQADINIQPFSFAKIYHFETHHYNNIYGGFYGVQTSWNN